MGNIAILSPTSKTGEGIPVPHLEWQQNAPKLFAPRNRFSLDRWHIINASYYYCYYVFKNIYSPNFVDELYQKFKVGKFAVKTSVAV